MFTRVPFSENTAARIVRAFKFGVMLALLAAVGLGLPGLRHARAQEADAPLYLETTLNKKEAWLGEPVLWKSCLWRCVVLNSNPVYIPPATDGFVSCALPQLDVDDVKNGRRFVGNAMVSYLIPQRAGELTVGSVQVQVPRLSIDVLAWAEFSDFFTGLFRNSGSFTGSSGDMALLASPPLTLTVRPLPQEGRPACFSGAVGVYRAEAALSGTSVCLDESFDLELHIKGQGNVPLVDAPAAVDFPGFKLLQQRVRGGFDAFAASAGTGAPDQPLVPAPVGERIVTYTLLAEKTGRQTLKVPDFAYFDPQQGKYALLPGQELSLQVRPAQRADASAAGPQPLSGSDLRGVWSGQKLPRWALPFMAAPLAGWVVLLYVPKRDYWSAGSMRRRVQRGMTRPQLWQEWQECHLEADLSTAQALDKLQNAGADAAQLKQLRSELDRLNRERFSGEVKPDGEKADEETWCGLLASLHKKYAAEHTVKTSPREAQYKSRRESLWRKYHAAAACLAAASAPLALLICSGLWMACPEDNAALQAYNRGCAAWRNGQIENAHYQFSCACRWGEQPEFSAAWRESAARLQQDSFRPPSCRRTVLLWWLWASVNMLAAFLWIKEKRSLACWLLAAALCAVPAAAWQCRHCSLAAVRSETPLRTGPGANYPTAALSKPGTLVWAAEERDGYVRLRRVPRVDVSAVSGSEADGELWIAERGLSYIDGE